MGTILQMAALPSIYTQNATVHSLHIAQKQPSHYKFQIKLLTEYLVLTSGHKWIQKLINRNYYLFLPSPATAEREPEGNTHIRGKIHQQFTLNTEM